MRLVRAYETRTAKISEHTIRNGDCKDILERCTRGMHVCKCDMALMFLHRLVDEQEKLGAD
jgi:hypothetical protein